MSVVEQVLESNAAYAARFDKGDLPMPPARRLVILTCMDARLDPAAFAGLSEGDAHVIRNAGGRASDDALRSVIISQQLLGTDEVIVIHHTDCGMVTFKNDDLRTKLQKTFGADASAIDFLPFADLHQSVVDDVATIKASPFVPKSVKVSGLIYDVSNGSLTKVC